jgi:phenylacetate-CoA ligase
MDPAERAEMQLRRFQKFILRIHQCVPFYRDALDALKIDPHSITSLEQLRDLPFTTKDDLRANYPLGLLAVSRKNVIRYHGSSGTTGKPTFVAYSRDDVRNWSDLCARFLVSGGLHPHHTAQVSFGYGLFTGAFGLHYGIERVGAGVIPVSSGNTEKQLMILKDLQVDALIATPSYVLKLIEALREHDTDPRSLRLSLAFLGGEPWTEDMRAHIEKSLSIKATNNYGLSEVIGPGVSGECHCRTGMHIQTDHFLVEVIDPETLAPVPDGTPGELVFTTITKEAMPLLRYRTRDIASITHEPCPCGRTTPRMSRVTGRTDDMLIIRGVNVFPSQIEEALLRVPGLAPHHHIELTRPGALDEVTIHVELTPEIFSDSMREMQALRQKIQSAVLAGAGISATINLNAPNTLQRFEGKARRVTDSRGLGC